MKRRISAAAAVTAALLLTAHSAAYGLFCSDVTAPAMQESSADLAEISAKFENALNAPETEPGTSEAETAESSSETAAELYAARMELYNSFCSEHSAMEYSLAEKLINYDLLLERLKAGSELYSELKETAAEMSGKYLVGECTKAERDEAEKLRDDKYYELQSLLFDISALKSEIEAQTGETLSSDFDFSSAYLITDALKLSADELSDWGSRERYTSRKARNIPRNRAILQRSTTRLFQGYYTLGEALRGYVSAAEDYESAAAGAKVGTVSASELERLRADLRRGTAGSAAKKGGLRRRPAETRPGERRSADLSQRSRRRSDRSPSQRASR